MDVVVHSSKDSVTSPAAGAPPVAVLSAKAAERAQMLAVQEELSHAAGPVIDRSSYVPQFPNEQTVRLAVKTLLVKLFTDQGEGNAHCLYTEELKKAAEKMDGMTPADLLRRALQELEINGAGLILTSAGKIENPEKIGTHFNAVVRIMNSKVDAFIIAGPRQLNEQSIPLSPTLRGEIASIVSSGECATLVLVKMPPSEAINEINAITRTQLNGLHSLWQNPAIVEKLELSGTLEKYLQFATVRVLTTNDREEIDARAAKINGHLEAGEGFEISHCRSVVKGIVVDQKAHALKESLIAGFSVVGAVLVAQHFVPGLTHSVTGFVDDVATGIGPDISQSLDKTLPLRERWAGVKNMLFLGLASIPASIGLGWLSARLAGANPHITAQVAAGVIFAFACSVGTLSTSVGAFLKARKALKELSKVEKLEEVTSKWTAWDKFRMAFKDSILDVPFRIGHTLVGVPVQIAAGVAAGYFGFFHSSTFVMFEGMAETVLGLAAVIAFSKLSGYLRNRRLRSAALPRLSAPHRSLCTADGIA